MYQTWQVVKALTENRWWKAVAPETETDFRYETEQKTGNQIRFLRYFDDELECGNDVPKRSDWRLYDERGNEVTDYV